MPKFPDSASIDRKNVLGGTIEPGRPRTSMNSHGSLIPLGVSTSISLRRICDETLVAERSTSAMNEQNVKMNPCLLNINVGPFERTCGKQKDLRNQSHPVVICFRC